MRTDISNDKAIHIIQQQGGVLRTREALALGIHPRVLYALRNAGLLQPLARGLYRLSELSPLENPDLVTVARQVRRGVICLISALAYHELVTQVPHVIDIALCQGDERPRLDYPPLRVYWFSETSWSAGTETYRLDDTDVHIYSPAKSVADSWKFRQKIGTDVALEALRTYRSHPGFDINALLRYARICRVERIMRPYLEALL